MPRWLILIFCILPLCLFNPSYVNAQDQANTSVNSPDSFRLLINIPARWIRLYSNDKCLAGYPVAVGKPATPTPTGDFKIIYKEINPTWISPDDPDIQIPSGDANPLGYRWMGFGGNYGIHGTNEPDSVGKFVSNGCIRVNENNVEALFKKVSVGTPVKIVYDRLIVEKAPDGCIIYYIYPDAYNMQPLTISDVNNRLKKFGVENFASDNNISNEISSSDGQPNYVAYPISLKLENNPLPFKAVKYNNTVYIPVYALDSAVKLPLQWDAKSQTISSKYGSASGIIKKDVIYINILDVEKVFNLQRDWQQPDSLILRVMSGSDESAYTAAGIAAPQTDEALSIAPAKVSASGISTVSANKK